MSGDQFVFYLEVISGVFLDDQGDVRYVAHDTARRGGATDEPLMAVLVHSGVPLGIKLSDEEDCSAQSLPYILYQFDQIDHDLMVNGQQKNSLFRS